MATPKSDDPKKYENHKSMIVLTAGGMRSRFSGTDPKGLMPLVEKLGSLDPKENPREYKDTLNAYLKLTRSR